MISAAESDAVDIPLEKLELHLFSRTTLIPVFGVLPLLITSASQKFSL